jgi:hypothetical protein
MTRVDDGGSRPGRALAGVVAVAVAVVALTAIASGNAVAVADNSTNASFVTAGERLSLDASASQEVVVDTSLSQGTVVTLRIRSTGSSPFLRSPQATVGPDGEATALVDLSEVPPGSTFEATLLHNGTDLASTVGVVGECDRDCEGTPTPGDDDPATGDEWLTDAIVMTTEGETARVPVAVPDDGPVTLSIEGAGYRVTVTGRDENGDGRVVFLLDTTATGPGRSPVIAVGDDEATVRAEETVDGRLGPADYDMSVTDGTGPNAPEVDVGTLVVRECTACPSGDDAGGEADPATGTPDWPDDESLLARPVVRARPGGAARIPLNVRDAATVAVGTEAQGYRLEATVRDENGDDRIALLFYPHNAGTSAPTVAVSDADSVTVSRETDRTSPLPAETYDIAVWNGTSTTGDGDDVGALQVLETNGSNATTPRASPSVEPTDGVGGQQFASGLGAIALGGVLAVVGIAVVLGVTRS